MKRTGIIILLLFAGKLCFSQASGIGYEINLGGNYYQSQNGDYTQSTTTFIQNGFIRFHSKNNFQAMKLLFGYRKDNIDFQNYSDFLSFDGQQMMEYNSDATIEREAWRLGVVEQFQFGKNKPQRCFGLNAGLYYEHTVDAYRTGSYNRGGYEMTELINPNSIGWILGAEFRWRWFTFGYKAERLFRGVIDHDYILSQELNLENSSELRGITLNPLMHYFVIGISLDFF